METVLGNLAEGLLARDCDVSVMASGTTAEDRFLRITEPVTGRVGRLIRVGRYGVLNSQPLNLSLVHLLRRELSLFPPDLVHLHLPNPLAAAAWMTVAGLTGGPLPPLLIWHHADITRQKLGKALVQPLVKRCLRQAVGISVSSVTQTRNSRELQGLQDRVRIIPFGIVPEPWVRCIPQAGEHFLFVGRLVPYKGLEVLLEAVDRLPAAQLIIVGSGPLEADLRGQIAARGLAGRVRLTGAVDPSTLVELMATARALVMPSIDASETFGLVQLEAMAAGLAVVASDLPTGVQEVGEAGVTGILVPPGDAEALAGALNRLLESADLASDMGSAARCRFEELYSRDNMVDNLLEWYGTFERKPR